jgi:Peptidase family M28
MMIQTKHELLKAYQEISSNHLMEHVRKLSHPSMRGRMPGDIGYERASCYIEEKFVEYGLEPLGISGSFRQPFSMEINRVISAEVSFRDSNGMIHNLALGQDFVCRGLTGCGNIKGDMVFVGYAQEDDPVDELADVDLNGKIAVSFKYPPPWSDNRRGELPRSKAHRLKDRGAIGLVLIPNPNRSEPDRISASLVESPDPLPDFPMIVLSENIATSLFDFGENTLASRQFRIDQLKESASGEIHGRMAIKLDTEHNPDGKCWNIIGLLKGRDPGLSSEAIVLGAHLDHVGIQGETVIFNGAQDNASGSAAILEIARILSNGHRPARSILFILFGAEEAGIIGSLYYGKHPAWPLNKTTAMLNLDCMGAGTGLDARGRTTHPHLFKHLDDMNQTYIQLPDTQADHPAGGADAEAFERAGIPNVFIVAKDPYQHLHMATDKPETLNPTVFESITRLTYLTAVSLLNNE